jgi:hypothetical protein
MFGMHRTRNRLFALRALFIVAVLIVTGIQAASAQDLATPEAIAQEPTQTVVSAVLCDDATCETFGDRLIGFEITAVNAIGGEVLDSCVVAGEGAQIQGCTLELTGDPTYVLTWDESQVPEGYLPFDYPILVEGGPGPDITYLGFYPADAPEPVNAVVRAALCTDATCTEYAEFLDAFEISALDPDTGEVLDTCATAYLQQADDYRCTLDVPATNVFELAWDESQVPAGYLPFETPIGSEPGAAITIAFIPAPGEVTMNVNAAICADAACSEVEEWLIGFEIFVVDKDTDEVYDNCVTSHDQYEASCTLAYPSDADVMFQGDKEAVPEGYVRAAKNGFHDDPPVTTLRYIPEDADPVPTPTATPPVTSLPDTGTGEPAVSRAGSEMAFVALAILAGATVAAAIQVVTRKPRR